MYTTLDAAAADVVVVGGGGGAAVGVCVCVCVRSSILVINKVFQSEGLAPPVLLLPLIPLQVHTSRLPVYTQGGDNQGRC